MNAADITKAVSVIDRAAQFISGNVTPGTIGKVELEMDLFMAAYELKKELLLVGIRVDTVKVNEAVEAST